ncbi:NACHT, LRR and PYD domains-containing protein [Pimephales promelas]|nr:NACHT, LRR and PYD domains-containing protein [Pimephales promelas]
MQIILAGSAKLYQLAAQFGLRDYWLAAADILNGANGGAWRRLRGLIVDLLIAQPIEALLMAQPIVALHIAQSIVAIHIALPIVDLHIAQSIVAIHIAQPIVDLLIAQPIVTLLIAQSIVTLLIAQPIVTLLIAQPIVDLLIAQSIVTLLIAQPIVTLLIAQSIVALLIAQSIVALLIAQPIVTLLIAQPIVTLLIAQSIVALLIAQSIVALLIAQSIVALLIAQSIVTLLIAQSIVALLIAQPIVALLIAQPIVTLLIAQSIVALLIARPIVTLHIAQSIVAIHIAQSIVALLIAQPIVTLLIAQSIVALLIAQPIVTLLIAQSIVALLIAQSIVALLIARPIVALLIAQPIVTLLIAQSIVTLLIAQPIVTLLIAQSIVALLIAQSIVALLIAQSIVALLIAQPIVTLLIAQSIVTLLIAQSIVTLLIAQSIVALLIAQPIVALLIAQSIVTLLIAQSIVTLLIAQSIVALLIAQSIVALLIAQPIVTLLIAQSIVTLLIAQSIVTLLIAQPIVTLLIAQSIVDLLIAQSIVTLLIAQSIVTLLIAQPIVTLLIAQSIVTLLIAQSIVTLLIAQSIVTLLIAQSIVTLLIAQSIVTLLIAQPIVTLLIAQSIVTLLIAQSIVTLLIAQSIVALLIAQPIVTLLIAQSIVDLLIAQSIVTLLIAQPIVALLIAQSIVALLIAQSIVALLIAQPIVTLLIAQPIVTLLIAQSIVALLIAQPIMTLLIAQSIVALLIAQPIVTLHIAQSIVAIHIAHSVHRAQQGGHVGAVSSRKRGIPGLSELIVKLRQQWCSPTAGGGRAPVQEFTINAVQWLLGGRRPLESQAVQIKQSMINTESCKKSSVTKEVASSGQDEKTNDPQTDTSEVVRNNPKSKNPEEDHTKVKVQIKPSMINTESSKKSSESESYSKMFKQRLKEAFQCLNEEILRGERQKLNDVFIEPHIIEEHDSYIRDKRPIKCNDIFEGKKIRTVLMKGEAGIGKTVAVQKFVLDWAEEKSNHDIEYIFPIPFQKLNIIRETVKEVSFMELLQRCCENTGHLNPESRVMLIFDGLNEFKLPLDFQTTKKIKDPIMKASVSDLLTNLIMGNLLPNAHIWITSRPAAANQIPAQFIDRVTEIQGFNGQQKKEYFRKSISDQSMANKVISHIRKSPRINSMCYLPDYCRIIAAMPEEMFRTDETGSETLTQMYSRLLLAQTDLNPERRDTIVALGNIAFHWLVNSKSLFCDEDLKQRGLRDESVLKKSMIIKRIEDKSECKLFCFVNHRTQEFLAALYVTEIINRGEVCQLRDLSSLKLEFGEQSFAYFYVLQHIIDKTLQKQMELFFCFLLGFRLESTQIALKEILTQRSSNSSSSQEIIQHIKTMIMSSSSETAVKSSLLLDCLKELDERYLIQEMKTQLKSGLGLSPDEFSALMFVLLNSEEQLDYLKSHQSEKLKIRPVVKTSGEHEEYQFGLGVRACADLRSNPSHLRELDLGGNFLGDSGIKQLSDLLKMCKLEKLRLRFCFINEEACAVLSSALRSNPSHLRELDLSKNNITESGMQQLSDLLKHPQCKLEKLGLYACLIKEEDCAVLTSALRSNPSHLKELDLSGNDIKYSGLKLLSSLLADHQCKLEKLSPPEEAWLNVCKRGLEIPDFHLFSEALRIAGS